MQIVFLTELYGELAQQLYQVVADQRIHLQYLKCLQATDIPSISPADGSTSLEEDQSTARDDKPEQLGTPMTLYNRLLGNIPAEVLSVPVILHCMLEQVSALQDRCSVSSSHVVKVISHFHACTTVSRKGCCNNTIIKCVAF